MEKKLIIFTLFLFTSVSLKAQTGNEIDQDSDWKERIFIGGNMGLSLGTDNTVISVSPIIGYRITNELSAGVGVSYTYQNVKIFNDKQSFNHYGGSVFARYTIYEPFFAMAQYEFMSYDNGEFGRFGYNAFLMGGGIMQPLGGNAMLAFTALYNFSYLEGEPGPYRSPWVIGGGVSVGF